MKHALFAFVLTLVTRYAVLAQGMPIRFMALAKDDVNEETLATTVRAAPCRLMLIRLTQRSTSSATRSTATGGVYVLEAKENTNAAEVLNYLNRSGIFEYVEPDHVGHAAAVTQPAVFPNDPFVGRQWSHHNDGKFLDAPATPDADADIAEAWTITTGSDNVIVAILDSGIKTDHREFDERLWRNASEIPDNQKDDDGNGYVDDVNGWNFVSDNPVLQDDAGHGTHIAGIIGATGNNNVGYAGVDWHCKLMALKVLDEGLQGYYSDWVAAIYYAVNHGASIINMSMGGNEYSKALEDAVQYAWDRNVLIVASMQNLNNETVFYPAGYAHALAVGATDPDDHRSESFAGTIYGSNYGEHLDVVAPGNYIYGLYHLSDTVYSIVLSGTSQATALVSGIASLLRARNPGFTAEQLEQRIETSAEDGVGKETEDTPGWDRFYGYGRVNADLALHPDNAGTPVENTLQLFPNPSSGLLRVVMDQKVALPFSVELCDSMGRIIFHDDKDAVRRIELSYAFDGLPPGLYVLCVRNKNTRSMKKWLKY